MEIKSIGLDFIYENNKVRARLEALESGTGNVRIDVVIDYADSVDEMKAAAITAAKGFLARVASGLDNPASVNTGVS